MAAVPAHRDADSLSQTGSNGGEAPPPEPVVQFTKTKMCKFEALGMCSKGSDCPFAHGDGELKPLPDLRCTKICKALIKTGVCQDATCTYAHSKEELRTIASTSSFKTKMCRFMAENGHCVIGSKCNFAHTADELRERPPEPPKPVKQTTPVKQPNQQRQGGGRQQASKMQQKMPQSQQPKELSPPKDSNTAYGHGQLRPPPGLGAKDDAAAGGYGAGQRSHGKAAVRREVGPSKLPGNPVYIPTTAMPPMGAVPPPSLELLSSLDAAAAMPWLSWGAAGMGLPPRPHVEELFGSQVGGCGAPAYESLFSSGLFGRNLLVDQADGVLRIRDGASPLGDETKGDETKRVPAVRTSATTLCSLADMRDM